MVRTTASVEYVVPRPHGNWWATSVVWGRNWKTANQYGSNAVLAETVVPIGEKNFVSGRYEWSQRDELFADNPDAGRPDRHATGARWFNVNAYTIGYTRDLGNISRSADGPGSERVALRHSECRSSRYYGDHPLGVNVYLRIRLR